MATPFPISGIPLAVNSEVPETEIWYVTRSHEKNITGRDEFQACEAGIEHIKKEFLVRRFPVKVSPFSIIEMPMPDPDPFRPSGAERYLYFGLKLWLA